MKFIIRFLPLISLIFLTSCSNKEDTLPNNFNSAPEWAREAIWYQIFPERFRNGDQNNDPTPDDLIGSYPGFVPDSWQISPWTKDWYAPDPYFKDVMGKTDIAGNIIQNFGQAAGLRRYGGDLQGVMDKLEYLKSLGITAIYFNPLNDAPSYHKYDARNWHHIDRNFGPNPEKDKQLIASENPLDPETWTITTADQQFFDLIKKCHEAGIRIIMDYSFNHTGIEFWAWKDIVEKQELSKYKDWYWINSLDNPETSENEFDYRGWFGVKTLPEIKETEYHDHAQKVEAFEGNISSDEVREHIFNVVSKWMDPNEDGNPDDGVDGFRLDVAAEVPLGFWREFRKRVKSINPEAYLVGEIWWEEFPDKLFDPQEFLQGDVFDAVMNYRWYRNARHFFNMSPNELKVSAFVHKLDSLREGLRDSSNYVMMNMASSHDSPRLGTSFFNKEKYKFKTEPSNNPNYKLHKPNKQTYETIKLFLAHQYTYIGAPHIWAGDEMGMWGADMGDTRKPLIWPDLDFEKESVHPLGKTKPVDKVEFNESLFQYYQQLIRIRKKYPVLSHGRIDYIKVDDENKILAYSRNDGKSEVIAIFNTSENTQSINLSALTQQNFEEILGNGMFVQNGKSLSIVLPGRKAAILSPKT